MHTITEQTFSSDWQAYKVFLQEVISGKSWYIYGGSVDDCGHKLLCCLPVLRNMNLDTQKSEL